MKAFVKRLALNNLVTIGLSLPNLGINFGTQFVLDVLLHWTGFWSLLAYLIGTALSMEYSILFQMATKSNFTVLGRKYHFNPEKKNEA